MPHDHFSVIIPSWNGSKLLPSCLDAMRTQTYRSFDVHVVDNASSDDTPDLVRERYPWVHLLQLPSNRGFTGAVNAGILASEGSWVALLNQDVEADQHWLEAMATAGRESPQIGAIACKILLHGQRDHFHSAGDGYRVDGIPVNRGVWQRDTGQYDAQTTVFSACGGAGAYRRAMLEDVGLLDESFFMYLEDVDLAWRHQLAGWPTMYVPQAVAYHHLSASGAGRVASYLTGRNTVSVIVKNVPAPLLQRHGTAMLAAQWRIAYEALRAWRGEAARARLRGLLAGLLTAPLRVRQRRAVQQTRRVPIEHIEELLQPID